MRCNDNAKRARTTVKKRSSTRYPKDGVASSVYITSQIAREAYEDADYIVKKIHDECARAQ